MKDRLACETTRFGQLHLGGDERIEFPAGILGIPQFRDYCVVNPADDLLILWLQSVNDPTLAFPILEPRIFYPDYRVQVTSVDRQELQLESLRDAAVYCIVTIPADITAMTANVKAPIVMNRRRQLGKQIILPDQRYEIKYNMFKALRMHLITIQSQKRSMQQRNTATGQAPIPLLDLPDSSQILV